MANKSFRNPAGFVDQIPRPFKSRSSSMNARGSNIAEGARSPSHWATSIAKLLQL
jgi:hypothetical protein